MDDDEFRETVIYAVLEGDGCYSAWSDAVDWPKYEAAVAEKRAEKLAEIQVEDPDFVPREPRCPLTLELPL